VRIDKLSDVENKSGDKPVLDEQAKKTILRKIPHGLYVCGVKDGEEVNGFTASWVMQASFTPPLVVNCVKQDSKSHAMIKASGVFALTVLEAGQKDLAQKFFKPQRRSGDKFEDVEFYLGEETGCPIIKDSLGYVECKVVGAVEQGDHTVYVGEVIGAGVHREGDALLLESTGWNYGG
jgi:flavin reductase (DIM6/NTAB) family NADH-FMN oxidoreductase RutF